MSRLEVSQQTPHDERYDRLAVELLVHQAVGDVDDGDVHAAPLQAVGRFEAEQATADALNISVGSVKSAASRGLATLRTHLTSIEGGVR